LLERFICGDCEHIYYADEKTACPACGSIQVFNVYKHIEMVLRNSILADSFMLNTQEEKEDVIQFASELFYPIKQKKH
jgi:reverse gyrase